MSSCLIGYTLKLKQWKFLGTWMYYLVFKYQFLILNSQYECNAMPFFSFYNTVSPILHLRFFFNLTDPVAYPFQNKFEKNLVVYIKPGMQ